MISVQSPSAMHIQQGYGFRHGNMGCYGDVSWPSCSGVDVTLMVDQASYQRPKPSPDPDRPQPLPRGNPRCHGIPHGVARNLRRLGLTRQNPVACADDLVVVVGRGAAAKSTDPSNSTNPTPTQLNQLDLINATQLSQLNQPNTNQPNQPNQW